MAMGVETRGALYGEVENGPQTELLVKKKKKKKEALCVLFFSRVFLDGKRRNAKKKCQEEAPRKCGVTSLYLFLFFFFFLLFCFGA